MLYTKWTCEKEVNFMIESLTLKKIVKMEYDSVSKFAKTIGWSYSKANRIVNENQDPSIDDMVEIFDLFNLDEKTFMDIFFKKRSTMCTKSA